MPHNYFCSLLVLSLGLPMFIRRPINFVCFVPQGSSWQSAPRFASPSCLCIHTH